MKDTKLRFKSNLWII